jgi:hypothetical protein
MSQWNIRSREKYFSQRRVCITLSLCGLYNVHKGAVGHPVSCVCVYMHVQITGPCLHHEPAYNLGAKLQQKGTSDSHVTATVLLIMSGSEAMLKAL